MEENQTSCPICSKECKYYGNHFWCPACGEYYLEPGTQSYFGGLDIVSQKYILSGVTRNASEDDNIIKIDPSNIRELMRAPHIPDGPIEAIDQILLYIYKKFGVKPAPIFPWNDYPIAYAKDPEEFSNLLKVAEDDEFLKTFHIHATEDQYQLTMKALNRLRDIEKKNPESDHAFVAMPFDTSLNEAWENGIRSALEETGYNLSGLINMSITKRLMIR